MITAHDIHKQFGTLEVLKGIDLTIGDGEVVSIVGKSGAGKTTLLNILGTLDKADRGEVIINGTDVTRLPDSQLSAFRNQHIGFIFQFHQLLPEFTAIENVMMPAMIAGIPNSKARCRGQELLEFLGLKDRTRHKPSELSGGERQRVAVARALMNKPDVIFADEPSGSLDTQNKQELHRLFFDLRKEFNQTFVIVTHDESLAQMSDRIIRMADGKTLPQPLHKGGE
ncbi:MAG: ABC transporter ATP-binding protein [Bacteroidales bacterium]|nr:ABC transporter ATP-binding protein [Candidatus Liminaster caballi]